MAGTNPKKIAKLMGGNGFREYNDYAAFSTTDTTVNVPAGGIRTVYGVQLTPVGSPNANEPLSVNETVAADGTFSVGADGVISIKRPAGTTSGLGFFLRVIGK